MRFLHSWFKDATKVRFWFLLALFRIFIKLSCCCGKVEGWNQLMSKACEQIWNLVEKRKMSNICLFSPCKIGLTSYWIYRTVWIWEKAAFPIFQIMPCPSFRIWQKFLKLFLQTCQRNPKNKNILLQMFWIRHIAMPAPIAMDTSFEITFTQLPNALSPNLGWNFCHVHVDVHCVCGHRGT